MPIPPFDPAASGLAWFKDQDGSIFHLPITAASWPGGYNYPGNPHDLSHAHENITHGGNLLKIVLSPHWIDTDFTLRGRSGECTRCGMCCGGCKFLVQHGRGIGHKNGTSCAIYTRRLWNGYKGCVEFPTRPSDIAGMTACTVKVAAVPVVIADPVEFPPGITRIE